MPEPALQTVTRKSRTLSPMPLFIRGWLMLAPVFLSACVSPVSPIGGIGNTPFKKQPYVAIGAGASQLELEIDGNAFALEDAEDTSVSIAVGSTFSPYLGAEIQLSDLGSATLDSGDSVGYQTASAMVLGRLRPTTIGANLFLRLGVGILRNESPDNPALVLETENSMNLVTGIGAEYLFTPNVGLRFEVVGHDQDARFASLGFLYLFGEKKPSSQTRPLIVSKPVSRESREPASVRSPVASPQGSLNEITAASELPPTLTEQTSALLTPPVNASSNGARNVPIQPGLSSGGSVDPSAPVQTDNGPVFFSQSVIRAEAERQANSAILAQNSAQELEQYLNSQTEFVVEIAGDGEEFVETPPQPRVQPRARPQTTDRSTTPVVKTDTTASSPQQPSITNDSSRNNDSDALAILDRDADGVSDAADSCLSTAAGIPVDARGCDLYAGIQAGIRFAENSAALEPPVKQQLDRVVANLQRFAALKLELKVVSPSAAPENLLLARKQTIEILRYIRASGVAGDRVRALQPSAAAAANTSSTVGETRAGVALRVLR